ncbi:hypothetical protein ACFE04_024109 [Oxalis oulophora]
MATSVFFSVSKPLKPYYSPVYYSLQQQQNNPKTQIQIRPESQTHHHNDPKLIINGPSTLSGHVNISGSKNSSLSLLAATLCCSVGSTNLHNVPVSLSDIDTMLAILTSLGAKVEVFNGGGDPKEEEVMVVVNCEHIVSVEPCLESLRKIRGGFFVIGPLLGRFGEAVVGLPGGCDIGARPVDLYVRGLTALGAVVVIRDGIVYTHVANGRSLVGARFKLDYQSVGATETLMMAASLADGDTLLSNVAKEPEVIDLARFLNNSGAYVQGAGTNEIFIKGNRKLYGSESVVSPDRIEAGTFMLAAAITRSCVSMSPVVSSDISSLIDKLKISGCKIAQHNHHTLEVSANRANAGGNLRGFDVMTGPFPGFPTDLQPQTMALLTTCDGSSVVEESVFDKRMSHVRELRKLGAKIQVCKNTALIPGNVQDSPLHGAHLVATDLRGGISLVLAGLAAKGTTEISGINHIERGYENLDTKLRVLGVDIKRLIPTPWCYVTVTHCNLGAGCYVTVTHCNLGQCLTNAHHDKGTFNRMKRNSGFP